MVFGDVHFPASETEIQAECRICGKTMKLKLFGEEEP